ncbi:MAG: MarR family transcriptional regulator [Ruminococcaceae bacterium]|nr:MarR family transcriptional regulator [Oscillospiraceae bacterium]
MIERFETFTVLINRIRRNMRRIKMNEMEEYGLRGVHMSCLYLLYTADGLTATELCEKCEEDKATVSRALEHLEEYGFITCKSRKAKRYKSPLVLTKMGKQVGMKVCEKLDRVLDQMSQGLSESERTAFYRALSIVSDNLQSIADTSLTRGTEMICENETKNGLIPIFFSTDDNYISFLDVAITSLIENASKEYNYKLIVLNTGLDPANVEKVMKNAQPGFEIEFVDIAEQLADIKAKLKDVYHFSIVTYYRLFIASLFPQYDKALYLDSDLVVTGDISELYNTELGENILGACPEEFVQNTPEFRLYAKVALGVNPDTYVNAGVLVMNLAQFRKNKIEKKFIKLITKYDFDLLDPDQAYLNYLCQGKILVLPNGWNKEPFPVECEGKKNIVHYALYKKPWQYDDTPDGEYFWEYAKRSHFYDVILEKKAAFGDKEKAEKEAAGSEILEHALKIVESDDTFSKLL